MSNDYRLNLLSEELDKYKVAVFKLTEENERLNSACSQLQSSELKQHLEKVNCERENYRLHKALEEIQKMFSEPCIEGENCFTCNSNCLNKDVLNITSEVLDEQ